MRRCAPSLRLLSTLDSSTLSLLTLKKPPKPSQCSVSLSHRQRPRATVRIAWRFLLVDSLERLVPTAIPAGPLIPPSFASFSSSFPPTLAPVRVLIDFHSPSPLLLVPSSFPPPGPWPRGIRGQRLHAFSPRPHGARHHHQQPDL